jgi:transcriptional antiterminator RfaH
VTENSSRPPPALWFAIFSKPRREAEAVEQLERQGFKTFLPKVRSKRRVRGQWRELIEPMFPRYLFIQAVLGEDDLRPVRSTRGVVGLVRFGGQLQPVPENVIAELHRLCPDERAVLELTDTLVPGCQVRILEGPFANLEAELLSVDGSRRALVLLKLLGQMNAVKLPIDILNLAS